MRRHALLLLLGLLVAGGRAEELRVGFAEIDVTPPVGDRPVWIAGYGNNRPAQGVHDPLLARAIALDDGERTIVIASVDLVGLQLPEVERIRAAVSGVDYVLVTSTHNHEGPDVIGIWGPTPLQRGVDEAYLDLVVERTSQCVRAAVDALAPASASYGTALIPDALLRDSREPQVKDDVLRVVAFHRGDQPDHVAGLVVQYSCHPESLGSRNQQLTADFPHVVVERLKQRYGCPVVYVTGAVGGLMSNPGEMVAADGETISDGNFEYAEEYGRQIADVVVEAVEGAEPISLTPFQIVARPIALPMANPLYRAAMAAGVLTRDAVEFTGDYRQASRPLPPDAPAERVGLRTEVSYLRLGELHVVGIPGEIYPELVYGRYQEPVEPNVDYPQAPLEPSVVDLVPSERMLLVGLANDEIGYILPKRQWDQAAPFAYGRDKSQYGEVNSCGPDIAPWLMQALGDCVNEADAR